ncbi:type II toxin-antitoxin system VapC family toxin [bacterium]|nr:MAG: PIN domain-containing protein [candidate division KSB1 bacterium]MCE7942705.1 PIN domain-containing protein [Chlorobi bacterium CHB1]MCL4708174.1 type II toxin-antitoxin system VapC family toxin [bacterium]MDL1875132.1 type II toxin-antitoxin system VapC family toxin [Cytophagia bacterium CHB2]MBC6952199.1 PIN domain-containing protein [candidate division KSB1 bacterium]
MTRFFVDSGYLIALEDEDDQNHEAALLHWEQEVSSSPPSWITTSYVLDEVVTYFNACNLHAKAVEIGQRLMSSPSIQFVHVDESLFQEAWSYFQRHNDKRYSLTDCVSFVLMTKMGIKSALTFDKHFTQAGFQKLP